MVRNANAASSDSNILCVIHAQTIEGAGAQCCSQTLGLQVLGACKFFEMTVVIVH